MALQVSNALTQALLQFRMNNLSKEVCTERVSVAQQEISTTLKATTLKIPPVVTSAGRLREQQLILAVLNNHGAKKTRRPISSRKRPNGKRRESGRIKSFRNSLIIHKETTKEIIYRHS